MKRLHVSRLIYASFWAASLLFLVFQLQQNAADAVRSTSLVIDAVLYDGYASGEPDEAVRLRNLSGSPVSLAGWSLNDSWDQNSRLIFPLTSTFTLTPGGTIWIARDQIAFEQQFGYLPEMDAADLEGTWIGLSNSGDELVLRDDSLTIIDALVYENGETAGFPTAWQGAAVQPYKISNSTAVEGQILYRRRDPETGLVVADSDTAADWAQDRADLFTSRKLLYPGWDLDLFFYPFQVTESAFLTVAVAPDNAFETLMTVIAGARKSLKIESHTFENFQIAEGLMAAGRRGVSVTLLLEGGPPGGVSDQQKYICRELARSGGLCWYMRGDKSAGIKARYDYLHAKFMLIDDDRVLVASENLSPNSMPSDPKGDGTWGRRGLFLVTDAAGVVDHFKKIWAVDFDRLNHRDIMPYTVLGEPLPGYFPPPVENEVTYTVRFPDPIMLEGNFSFEIVQAPENALHPTRGILGMINRAEEGDLVLVQQLSERPYWGPAGSSPLDDPNPRLEAYLNAARRGARVRVLLDRYFDDPDSLNSNSETCNVLLEVAEKEYLDLRCKTGNPAGLGIHNKMILVQAGGTGYVHIGSINGTEQSHKGNREAALQIQSNELFAYLARMYFHDWDFHLNLPVIFQDFLGPAAYPLITEILADPVGGDESEFVEFANPTGKVMDISGYGLSDAISPEEFADMRRFPEGTILLPGQALVVAQQGLPFQERYGFLPDFEILDSTAAVPDLIDDLNWGDPAQFFRMGNTGDVIFLRNREDLIIDVVAYGEKSFNNQASCDLAAAGHSLRRRPYWLDTDNCVTDFEVWPAPDPGQLPLE